MNIKIYLIVGVVLLIGFVGIYFMIPQETMTIINVEPIKQLPIVIP